MVEHFAPKYSHKPLTKSFLCMFFISAVASALSFLLPATEMSCYSSLGVAIAEFPALREGKIAESHIYIYISPLSGDSQHVFSELMFAYPGEYKHHWDLLSTWFKYLNPLWSLRIPCCCVKLHLQHVHLCQCRVNTALGKNVCVSTGSINFVIQFSINTLCFTFPESVDISVVSKCNPCLSNPCKNNGTCNNDPVEFYQCTCHFGFKVWLQMNYMKSNKAFHMPSAFLIVVPWEVNFTGNWAQKIPYSSRL